MRVLVVSDIHANLTAFDAGSGKPVWSLDIVKEFEGKYPRFGFTESVLIDGDKLICSPGGSKGYMVALDKKTGKVIWANTDIGEIAGFSSAILAEDQGIRQIINLTTESIIGVHADSGKLLWKYPFTNKRKNNIPTPIYHQGHVFASTGYGTGSVMLKVAVAGETVGATQAWFSEVPDNIHGGVILLDGHLYGSGHEKKGWTCLDFASGKTLYRDTSVEMGSITYADGMLYCLGERGTMALVKCNPSAYEVVSRFNIPESEIEDLYWSHPVVCGGRLYVRHGDNLYAYDVRGK